MANQFDIVISATDKATAVMRKVNDAMSRITRPFDQTKKSFQGFGREIGFGKISKSFDTIVGSSNRAARGISSIVAPMAAITGLQSVSGIIGLAEGWAELGRNVSYSAGYIGTSTVKLQAFQGAAKLAGLSSEAMTGALQNLGDTMEDAVYGRNQQALMVFNRLGVGIKRTKDGAMDATSELTALSAAIYRLKTPQQQNVAAGALGLTALLPLIRQGPAAFDRLTEKAKAMGLVLDGPALQSSIDFAASLAALKASGAGLTASIGNALIPAIKPLIDQLSGWITKNRDLISSNVGAWAKDFGKWVGSINWKAVQNGITDLISKVGSLVDMLGGWKNTAIAVALVMNGSLVASVLSTTTMLAKGVIGVLAYAGSLVTMRTAATEAAAANRAAAASGAGFLKSVGRGGLMAGAAAGGIYVGTKISDAMDGTSFGDHFAHGNTKALGALLSAIGFRDNEFSRATKSDGFDQKYQGASWLSGLLSKRPPASPSTGASVSKTDPGLIKRAIAYFQQQGWSPAQASGITANLVAESGLNARSVGDHGSAYGIAQWHADRQRAFEQWSGKRIQNTTVADQLKFVNYELTQGSEKAAGNLLRQATTAREAGAAVSAAYERPANERAEANRRADMASSLAPLAAPPAPSGPYSSGAGAQTNGTVHVQVELKNAPPGTRVITKPSGQATASTKIRYSSVGTTA